MVTESWTQESVHQILVTQQKYFRTGVTLDVSFRISQLKKLHQAVQAHEQQMLAAMKEDLGRHPTEAYFCDIGAVLLEINEMIRGLRKWARPERHFSGLLCFPSVKTKVYKMPYGSCLIISPFNFPFLLSLGVLAAAISGGNTAVIKASSKSAACTKVLQELIAQTFPPEYITVIGGGHETADLCLAQPFDKVFYTGSPKVAKHVLSMASENLTPVALELGGETGNWCIVRKDADLADAARKIAFIKTCNAGQICININQVAVAEEVADRFLELLKAAISSQVGEHAYRNEEYPCLISDSAYLKCAETAAKNHTRVVFGGEGDAASRKFDPTLIYPVDISEPLVQHELFCPLLPIVPFADGKIDDLLNTIAARQHGLALYLFTKDLAWAEKVMQSQQFGGGCINEVILQIMVKGVPFNGTGHSGMGAYHGEWGFREFTHPQTVLFGKTKGNLPLREHPYGGPNRWKARLVRLFER